MSKKVSDRQENVDKPNGKGGKANERADFESFAQGRPSYIERGWARAQEWAVTERPDRQPAPMLTPEAKAVMHPFALTPEAQALLEAMNHADRD